MAIGRNEGFYGHFAGSKRAGLVESDTVDTGEGFDGIEVLDEDFFATEANSREGEHARGEEDEALRNHIDKSGDGAGDGDFGGFGLDAKTRPEEKGADRDKSEGNVFDDVVHDFEKFGVSGLDSVGAGFEFFEIAVFDGGLGDGFTSARDDKATRDELVFDSLFEVVLFASDEGFVDFDASLSDFAVDEDLVANRINDDVAFFDVFLVDLKDLAVSFDSGFLLGQKFHFVNGVFGADFVDDSNESVGDSDKDKEEIFVRADDKNHASEDEVDEIKNRKSVFGDDFGVGVHRLTFLRSFLADWRGLRESSKLPMSSMTWPVWSLVKPFLKS